MPATTRTPRSGASASAGRRGGHIIGALVNGVLYYLVNVRPGWEVWPSLTPATVEVLPLVNASILTGLVVELVQVLIDARRLRALGAIATSAVGLAASLKVWSVFPFDFGGGYDWTLLVRIVVGIGIVGSFVGILAAIGLLLWRPTPRAGTDGGDGNSERAGTGGDVTDR